MRTRLTLALALVAIAAAAPPIEASPQDTASVKAGIVGPSPAADTVVLQSFDRYDLSAVQILADADSVEHRGWRNDALFLDTAATETEREVTARQRTPGNANHLTSTILALERSEAGTHNRS